MKKCTHFFKSIKKVSFALILLSACLFFEIAVSTNLKAQNIWALVTPLPTARYSMPAAVVDNIIYVFGGWNNSQKTVDEVEFFNPATLTWGSEAKMTSSRGDFTATVLDNKIYLIGGRSNMDEDILNLVEVFDPATNEWSSAKEMPEGRCLHASCACNGKIYVFGGISGDDWNHPCAAVLEYDPAEDAWSAKSNMEIPRFEFSAVNVNERIYTLGGLFVDGTTTHYGGYIERYNPETDAWKSLFIAPSDRALYGAAVLDGKIYVVGGTLNGALASMDMYDPADGFWRKKLGMEYPRFGCAAAVAEYPTGTYHLYVIGGATDWDTPVNYTEELTIIDPVVEVAEDLPGSGLLDQNYPNPFIQSTLIKFRIPDCDRILLRVYDINGREIATLLNEMMNPGSYEVNWKADDYPAGIYFYRLETGSVNESRKLILQK
jgi:N-acetylneuraminic acid mutarotase